MPNVNAELAVLFERQTSVTPDELRPDVALNHDLGMAGDDGFEFMQALAEKFTVDLAGFD